MESLSSPVSPTSPSATVRTPSSKQPTYTTAGTIYNPNASQPLQPPTRRGRSFKWSQGGFHTDLALLPKSVLATLPLRGALNRAPNLHQYSPLQQNYDRAVSPNPLHSPEHILARMSVREPQGDSDDGPKSLASLFAGSSEDKSVHDDESDYADSESDFGTDPLLGMTVKSLQNLASYPNPNQKRARKALLGAKTNLQGMGIPGRILLSPKPTTIRPIGSPPKSDTASSETIVHGSTSIYPPLRRGQGPPFRGRFEPTREGPPGLLATANIMELKAGPSTLSDGPGAPRPLTAGPPGLRQYRPSTFDSTFKALQTQSQQSKGGEFTNGGLGGLRESHVQNGTDELHFSGLSSTPLSQPSTTANQSLFPQEQTLNGIGMAQGLQKPPLAPLSRVEASTSDPDEPWIPSVRDPRSESRLRFEPGTDRLSKSEIRARNEKIANCWYAGSSILGKPMADSKSRKLDNSLGVIGDRRPVKNKNQYPPISIEEANKMTTAEHAKPLLNMTLEGIIRHLDESLPKTMRDDV